MERINLSEQEILRRESLAKLRELGIDPYPAATFETTATTKDIKSDKESKKVAIAGRIMSRRIMGSASFFELQDEFGRAQVYVKRDNICPPDDPTMYDTVFRKLLDIGDIVGVNGEVFTTKTGELSIRCEKLTVLSKSVRPLPIVKEKDGVVYDAFTDPEQRYRRRCVDLVVNPEVREIFLKRAKIISTMRRFFDERGYVEVETPILQPIPGGAAARPFETHHNALDMKLYLRIANELYLKRLIVGGFSGVYEFAKNFRNEGMDRTHNPEFTGMEIYVAYKDYFWMMEFMETLIDHVAREVNGTTVVDIDGRKVDFKAPYRRLSITEAIKNNTGFDITGKSEAELREACRNMGIEVDDTMGKGKLIDEIFGAKCEDDLIQPTFITDYPIDMSPLSKTKRDNPELTERFELFVAGKELCNAYSELNDPIDQLERFKEQMKLSERGDDEAMFIDMEFVRALEYGMPTCAGLGIGIDRLTMFLTGQNAIQEVLLFPHMRPEVSTKDNASKFTEIGVPEEWIEPLSRMGITTLNNLASHSAGKLFNDMCGYNKKNKLGLKNPVMEEVAKWIESTN